MLCRICKTETEKTLCPTHGAAWLKSPEYNRVMNLPDEDPLYTDKFMRALMDFINFTLAERRYEREFCAKRAIELK